MKCQGIYHKICTSGNKMAGYNTTTKTICYKRGVIKAPETHTHKKQEKRQRTSSYTTNPCKPPNSLPYIKNV
jgi:signal recognition particle receptor subunit beta